MLGPVWAVLSAQRASIPACSTASPAPPPRASRDSLRGAGPLSSTGKLVHSSACLWLSARCRDGSRPPAQPAPSAQPSMDPHPPVPPSVSLGSPDPRLRQGLGPGGVPKGPQVAGSSGEEGECAVKVFSPSETLQGIPQEEGRGLGHRPPHPPGQGCPKQGSWPPFLG